MNRCFFFLFFRSAHGRLIRALRLLRQPKYLVGVLIAAFWMGAWLVPWWLSRSPRGREASWLEAVADFLPAVQLLLALTMAFLVTVWWLIPVGKPALGLSEAEIEMLSPAPLPRRHLLQYSILKAQPTILFGSLVLTVFAPFSRWGAVLHHFVSTWLLLSLWDLHSKGRKLWLGSVRQLHGGRAAGRWAALCLALALYWTALAWGLAPIQNLTAVFQTSNSLDALARFSLLAEELGKGLAGWLLLPFLCLTDLFAANFSGGGFTRGLSSWIVAALLLALHNEWVVRSRTRFEEASLEAARRKDRAKESAARHLKQTARARRQAPFTLRPLGLPEIGVLWKNLIMVRRTPLTRQALIAALAALGVGLTAAFFPVPGWIFSIPLIAGMILLFSFPLMGPRHWRNDLRVDLRRVETIRPWPIPGWRLAAAEALGPAAVGWLAALLGAALIVSVDLGLLLGATDLPPIGEVSRQAARIAATPRPLLAPLALLGLLPVSAAVAYFSSALQNFAALAFPGWVPLGTKRREAAATAGHNILMAMILMLATALGLFPGLLLAGLTILLQTWMGIPFTGWEFPLLGLLAALPFLGLSALLVGASGKLWDRLDPSRELLTE